MLVAASGAAPFSNAPSFWRFALPLPPVTRASYMRTQAKPTWPFLASFSI